MGLLGRGSFGFEELVIASYLGGVVFCFCRFDIVFIKRLEWEIYIRKGDLDIVRLFFEVFFVF